jgi:PAS domain S-box-containing protein
LADFFRLYVAHFEQLNKDIVAKLLPHPQWGPLIAGMSQEVRDEQNRVSLDFMRTAFVDGDWEPLLESMRDQGAQYAQMGFSFASWYEILGPFRHYLVPIMVRELMSDPARLATALQAMSLYIDVAMSVIGDQYIDSKEELIHNQKFYTRSLVEANVDALTATDRFGIITDVNKQMEVLAGCSRDELIGSLFSSHFTDLARAAALITQAVSTGKVTDYDLTVHSRDGKTTEVAYNATTFSSRDRTLAGVFAAARDLTRYIRR